MQTRSRNWRGLRVVPSIAAILTSCASDTGKLLAPVDSGYPNRGPVQCLRPTRSSTSTSSMPRDLILGTAGHIDHGKTSLVKALTGIDCDRLPEEKERGITIDIGFANLDLGDYRLGIVDVPGHERFVKNMLAGATGIDLALLVVAADDSVMPQTREHLEILKLLGVRRGVVALTKADLVDETTREVVAMEVRELVRDSFLADAPIVADFRRHRPGHRPTQGRARKDRRGCLAARGCRVVPPADRSRLRRAGAWHGGHRLGRVRHRAASATNSTGTRATGRSRPIRVRGLTNHGQQVGEVHRGQRAGVNLAGVPHEAVRRGQELCAPGYLAAEPVITVRLSASRWNSAAPIKHRLPVRLHVGTAEVMATVSLLDCDQVDPGKWGLAQLFLEEPVTTVWGQAFVVRDSSAEHTLGGGQVLQPVAGKIRRRHFESLARVEQLWSESSETRLLTAAWFAEFRGVTAADVVRGAGVGPDEVAPLVAQLLAERQARRVLAPAQPQAPAACRTSRRTPRAHPRRARRAPRGEPAAHDARPAEVLARLEYVGDDAPTSVRDRSAHRREEARRRWAADRPSRLQTQTERQPAEAQRPDRRGPRRPRGSSRPSRRSSPTRPAGTPRRSSDIFEVAVAEGLLVRVTDDIYLSGEADGEMRRRVIERLQSGPGATVAEIRDLLGTTRKFAVPICEYLDRIGLTRRRRRSAQSSPCGRTITRSRSLWPTLARIFLHADAQRRRIVRSSTWNNSAILVCVQP